MWTQWLTWLRKTAPEEPHPQHIARLLNGLRSPELVTRRRADMVVSRLLTEDSGQGADFTTALLEALGEQIDPDLLELVPRYVPLLANAPFAFGRRSPIQAAAQACLDRWQAQRNERAQAHTLLRAAARPANGDTLLRPVVGSPPTEPDQLLRASESDK